MQTNSSIEKVKHEENPTKIDTVEGVSALASPRVVRSILIFVVAGVALYGAATLASDYRAIVTALLGFPVAKLAQVIGLVLIGWLLRGWRFHYYLKQGSDWVPLRYSVAAFLAGFALTGTPGKVGEAVKAVFLKRDYGVSMTRVVGIVMVERLMDLWGVLMLGSFSLILFSGWWHLFLLCVTVVVAAGIFLCMESVYRPVLDLFGRISFLSWISGRILGVLSSGRDLMTLRIFVVGLLVSSVAWGMESLSFYVVLAGLELPSTLLEANFAYCFSTIVGALSMLPGGIGGAEASMIGILKFMGIPYADGLPAVILIRLCTLWFAILLGVIFMIVLLARTKADKLGAEDFLPGVPGEVPPGAPFKNS